MSETTADYERYKGELLNAGGCVVGDMPLPRSTAVWKNPPPWEVRCLLVTLEEIEIAGNDVGGEGWEFVTLLPATRQPKNENGMVINGPAESCFFCIYKRQKPTPVV